MFESDDRLEVCITPLLPAASQTERNFSLVIFSEDITATGQLTGLGRDRGKRGGRTLHWSYLVRTSLLQVSLQGGIGRDRGKRGGRSFTLVIFSEDITAVGQLTGRDREG